jgi:hypothetical protein
MLRRTGGFTQIDFFAPSAAAGIVVRAQRRLSDVSLRTDAGAIWRIALAIANEIEGDAKASEDWMCQEAISEFGGLTASDLIEVGQGWQVIDFLMGVLAGLRG